jgi:pimeloyl-ACP methyl ester carboxylesterase
MRYVLVNGGCHGAWCWDLLIPELANLGHDAVAVELPGHGARVAESATLTGYRDAVVAELHRDDVLVGHFLGCGVATIAADARPELVRHICLLSGPLPVEGRPLLYQSTTTSVGGSAEAESDSESLSQRNMILTGDGSAFTFDRAGAYETFFHDCPDDVVDWAVAWLTPQQLAPTRETVSIPRFWAADLPRSYILCLQDRAWNPARLGSPEPSTRRRATHDRLVAFTLPQPPSRTGSLAGVSGGHRFVQSACAG